MAWEIPPQKNAPASLTDPDEHLVQVAQELPEPEGIYSGQGPAAQRNKWGNVFPVQVGFNAVYPDGGLGPLQPGLNTPSFPIETDCTLILQIISASIPAPYQSSPSQTNAIIAVVTYGVGAVTLTKNIVLRDFSEKRVQLCCRNVQVSFQAVDLSSVGSTNLFTVNVVAAVVPGHTILRDAYLWSPGNIVDGASHGFLWPPNSYILPQPWGIVGNLHVTLETVASAVLGQPLYALLLDEPSGYTLAGGESPIPFGVSGAMVNPGDQVSYSGLEMPEGATFNQGLLFVLSTTAGTYTAATGTVTAHVDSLVGQ